MFTADMLKNEIKKAEADIQKWSSKLDKFNKYSLFPRQKKKKESPKEHITNIDQASHKAKTTNLDDGCIKTYRCDVCDETYTSLQKLGRHVTRVHRKPFRCGFEKCNKKFGTSWDLRKHEATHFQEKKYSCSFCEMKFVDPCNLSRHVSSFHIKVKAYLCHRCSKAFARYFCFFIIIAQKSIKIQGNVCIQIGGYHSTDTRTFIILNVLK
ncbi:hypothetical protein RFI_16160 [Reticulomyxa filosa]|uniref:C2H2-type domain-containing protein n=1 Tax=Reticulomyxa filosa TaxID=46433 RepID=X6N4U2_RETFI|nr:hypothetical protein RFI_16160 [Reticulomyxa filosa]|eukprot:ETO21046.1 hypothetical protein RFI_16160 [Reticulomyxa filosa]